MPWMPWYCIANAAVWGAEGVSEGAVMPFSKALSHAALNPPEGHVNQLEALRHYLLQVENQLWGVLDRGWTGELLYLYSCYNSDPKNVSDDRLLKSSMVQ